LVGGPDNSIVIDLTGKQRGRGAYLCDRSECWDKARTSEILDRALKMAISAEAKQALAQGARPE
jgi:predicted RNA-binding protein YlxR (DUF448 family)